MKSIIYQIAQDTRVRDREGNPIYTITGNLFTLILRLLIGVIPTRNRRHTRIRGYVDSRRDKCKWCKLWNLRVMGFFSFKTTDTGESIPNIYSHRHPIRVVMKDNTGNHWWTEWHYDGYGIFGGKDIYELAEMNGRQQETRG